MPYKPIDSYGIIGNLHSVALVANDGSIDWCCLPHFDSPSVFASILDENKGGLFRIAVRDDSSHRQLYLPETNILITRFLGQHSVGEVLDFMPVAHKGTRQHEIFRIVHSVHGSLHGCLECCPAYDYGRAEGRVEVRPEGALFEFPGADFALLSPVPLERCPGGVRADFTLGPGEQATFIFRHGNPGDGRHLLEAPNDGQAALDRTTKFWRMWLSKGSYTGRWREMVERSALVLKLLTFDPTGAIVAAPTCSLPEEIGGVRNWDYRYTWIRDAAFTIYAFLRLGFTEEAANFMHWLQNTVEEKDTPTGPLRIMYSIHGSPDIPETELSHLAGYRGSRPVRVGNAAVDQLQLDIYGELIDSVYLYDKYVTEVSYDLWVKIRGMMRWVARHWETPDEGIWEVRSLRRHFVYSKMQCWVALDRGLRLAMKRGLPNNREWLRRTRDRIYESVMTHGWSERRQSFVQHYGSDSLDASNLLMPLVRFVSPTDPRMLSTIDRTMEELVTDSLVYRYQIGEAAGDGLAGTEGTFSVCTFWLVESLARAGRVDEARLVFEKMLTYANPLGLYSEQIGLGGQALGNFPQAFTHLGLISAAFRLDKVLR